PDQEIHTQETTMTITVGPHTRLTREVLEAASPQERAELLAARVAQVEQLRQQRTPDETPASPPARATCRPAAEDLSAERWGSLPQEEATSGPGRSQRAELRRLRILEGTWEGDSLVDASRARS